MKRTSITLIILLVMSRLAFSQVGSLKGIIKDAVTKKPVHRASIQVKYPDGTLDSTVSKTDGSFEWPALPSGTCTFSVYYSGKRIFHLPLCYIKSNQPTDLKTVYVSMQTKTDAKPVVKEVQESIKTEGLNEQTVDYQTGAATQVVPVASGESYSRTKANYSMAMKKKTTGFKAENKMPRGYVQDKSLRRDNLKNNGLDIKNAYDSVDVTGYEEYNQIIENPFKPTHKNLLSTFSIDVDKAGYSNVRRYIQSNQIPPADVARTEEMMNYFHYNYPQPAGDAPFAIVTEMGECPWNPEHKLLHVGLQGKIISLDNIPSMNLVFLIDVSGSMSSYNKLPYVIESLKLLTAQLREQDRIGIVVYAGTEGVVLPPTPGNEKNRINEALSRLQSGGGTAGGAGIIRAYKEAASSFIPGGVNRIILCTDGDFNVGISSDAELQSLVEEKRKTGISLSVLGFGMGNYKDNHLEILADKGNGNYAYIDNLNEAKKVLVKEMGGTLYTIAKDVKIQMEFNPAYVKEYRLIGYENRKLNNEDFENDAIDAGDLGSGHNVTALYEIVPNPDKSETGVLVYDSTDITPSHLENNEWLYVKLRYKNPNEDKSRLLIHKVDETQTNNATENFYFSASVAEFAMLLHHSAFLAQGTYEQVIALAEKNTGNDRDGYRKEFVELVKKSQQLSRIPQAAK